MSLFSEAGIFGWLGVVLFAGGLMYAVVRPERGVPAAKGLAVIVMAIGMLGSSLGQRLVDRAVDAEPELAQKVVMLSVGTRETSANLLLASLFALALMGVAAALQWARRERAS